ncbi:MAG TPA: C45 family peptidase [Acidimicrobiia bacterium]
MYGGKIRVLALGGSPGEIGHAHGSALGSSIRQYLDDRLDLAGDPYWSGRTAELESIVGLAQETLGAHRRYSEPLYEEMAAMATSAGIDPAEAVVVGGFTDLIDVVRVAGGPSVEEDDCTGIIDADNGVLAQTWDMHASAGEFVYLFDIEPDTGPRAKVQTTAGCVGQMGINEAGIAVGINNLTSRGKVGVTWPFVVRKVLQQTTLDGAIEMVLSADLAGGHNFFIMGPDGTGCNIEAMPESRKVTRVETGRFCHTNHCLDPETKNEEGARNPIGAESSLVRLERANAYGPDLEAMFADAAINRGASSPHDVATCGAVVMRTGPRTIEAVWGQPGSHDWETFAFA